jgi:hypothetical protein
LLAREEDISKIKEPDEERSVLYCYAILLTFVFVILKTNEIAKEKKTEYKSEESCLFHELVRVRVVRSIFEYCPEINFKLEKSINIPCSSPKVKYQKADSSEHWKNIGHRSNMVIILVKFQNIENEDK